MTMLITVLVTVLMLADTVRVDAEGAVLKTQR
jgi:hypothetical protein